MAAPEPHQDGDRSSGDAPTSRVARLKTPDSDAVIVKALRARHSVGAAGLFDRYHLHVRRVLLHVLGPDPELSDLVQEVFAHAIASVFHLEDPSSLRGWLGSIAVFTARARMRRRSRWRFLELLPNHDLPEVEHCAAPPEIDEAFRAAYRVLERLPVDERIAFALRFIDGMDLAEIANSCGTSRSTAKRRVGKARARFEKLALREPSLVEWLEGTAAWQA
jgi:RNA polymerase sigma-70 factor (ECF subfamily)